MTSYDKKRCDSLKELIPLYARGTLKASEKSELEAAIEACPELKQELRKWEEIHKAYRAIDDKSPLPTGRAYSEIASRIRVRERRSFFEWLMPSPAFSFGVAAAQFLIIIALAFYAAGLRHEYRTMSGPSISTEQAVRLNVVFKEQATSAEIKRLLLRIDGKILDGPYDSGLFVVGILADKYSGDVLNILRESGLVTLAERAY